MMYKWTDDMVRFMLDASSDTQYFENLASLIKPYIEHCRTVCDAGCGLGQLADVLSCVGFEVTGADISEKAINQVRKLRSVKPLLCDLSNCESSLKWDAMIFNYYGRIDEIVSIAKKHCLKKVIVIKKNYRNHRFSFAEMPIKGYMNINTEDYLSEHGIKFTKTEFSSELGQPFRNIEDAVKFFEIYSRDEDRSLINEKNIRKRLVERKDDTFPLYMPHVKKSLVFVLDMEDLR